MMVMRLDLVQMVHFDESWRIPENLACFSLLGGILFVLIKMIASYFVEDSIRTGHGLAPGRPPYPTRQALVIGRLIETHLKIFVIC